MLIEAPTLIIPCMEDRGIIGKYTAKNGPARATRHLSVTESMARSVQI